MKTETTFRPTTNAEQDYDVKYQRRAKFWHSLVVAVFHTHINKVVKYVLIEACVRGQINTYQLHTMAACCDRVLWPERHEKFKPFNPHKNHDANRNTSRT